LLSSRAVWKNTETLGVRPVRTGALPISITALHISHSTSIPSYSGRVLMCRPPHAVDSRFLYRQTLPVVGLILLFVGTPSRECCDRHVPEVVFRKSPKCDPAAIITPLPSSTPSSDKSMRASHSMKHNTSMVVDNESKNICISSMEALNGHTWQPIMLEHTAPS
jgi:hypothetical protein